MQQTWSYAIQKATVMEVTLLCIIAFVSFISIFFRWNLFIMEQKVNQDIDEDWLLGKASPIIDTLLWTFADLAIITMIVLRLTGGMFLSSVMIGVGVSVLVAHVLGTLVKGYIFMLFMEPRLINAISFLIIGLLIQEKGF